VTTPPIRLGNGLALWLGVAVLAHAALLAVPVLMPDGPGSRQGGLQVRLTKPVAGPTTGPVASDNETTDPVRQEQAPEKGSVTFSDAPNEPAPSTEFVVKEVANPVQVVAIDKTSTTGTVRQIARVSPPAPPVVQKTDNDKHTRKSPVVASVAAAKPKSQATSATRASLATNHETGSVTFSGAPNGPAPSTEVVAKKVTTPLQAFEEKLTASAATTMPAAGETVLAMAETGKQSTAAEEAITRSRLLELTGRLHRAIERQKHYPLSARRLGREGTTSVAFRMNPSGAIDSLEVAASSGEPSLDRAALRAVRGISPFDEAGAYLDETAPFRVDIAFRLR